MAMFEEELANNNHSSTLSLKNKLEKTHLTEEENTTLPDQISYMNPLSSYLSKVMFQDEALFQHNGSKTLQIVKIVAGVIGSTTGIPFISPSLKAGKAIGVEDLGWVIGGAETLAYGGKVAWVMTELIDNFNQKSEEERKIFKQNKYKNFAKHLICNLLGVVASTPLVYLSYNYNDFKPLAVLTFVGSYSTRALGYYKLSDQIPSLLGKKVQERKAEEGYATFESPTCFKLSKEQIANMIKSIQLRFLKMSSEERELTFQGLSECSDLKKVYKFLSLHENQNSRDTVVAPDLWGKGIPRKIALGLSTIVPIGNALVNIVASYKGAKTVYDNEIFAGSVVVLSVLPNFALDMYVTRAVAGNIFDSIYNKYKKRETVDIMATLYPRAKYFIPVLAFTTTVLSLGNDAFIGSDTLKDSFFSQIRWPLTGLLVVSNIQFKTYAITDLLYNVSIHLAGICDKPKKKLVNFIKHLNIFSYFNFNSDEETISNFSEDIIDKDINERLTEQQ